jgi:uncharacterized protein (TIGR02996 family)
MTPREQLLAALVLAPADETAWLALADCLEEDGEPRRGELIRAFHEMRRLRPGPKRRAAERRVIDLLAAGVRPCVPEFTNSVGMRLAFVPPGQFRMGSPARGEPRRMDDETLHPVRITRGFWLGVHAVTQAEFRAVTRRAPAHHGPRRLPEEGIDHGRFPVENVSWVEAVAFCNRLSQRRDEAAAGRAYRLPTEAEWEYACRAGLSTREPFHYGASLQAGQANFDCRYPYPPVGEVEADEEYLGRPCEVGRYVPNAFGLHDMHGNVDEWCHDWYGADYYEESPADDPRGPDEGHQRIIRGGSWRGQGEDARAAVRIGYDPEGHFSHVGFRVACDIST